MSPLEQFLVYSIFHINTLTIYAIIIAIVISIGINRIWYYKRNWVSELVEFTTSILTNSVGPKASKYLPLLQGLFLVILVSNLLGMVPYSFTITSQLALTLSLSFTVFLTVTIIGIVTHRMHFLSLFVPHGVPKLLLPLLIPIEILSYLARALSLGIRLFANIMSGHALLKILASFGFLLILTPLSVFPFLLVTVITCLEAVIAILQAYVFTLLTAIYLNDTLYLH